MRTIAMALLTVALAACSGEQQQKQDVSLATDAAKFSYALGIDVGRSLKNFGGAIDEKAFQAGIHDALAGNAPRLSDEEMRKAKQQAMQKRMEEIRKQRKAEAEENLKKAEAFLAENAKKPEVKTTPSGLQYQVLREGNGKRPKAHDLVRVHYEGRLLDGTVFDSSYARKQPVVFRLDQVIPGWREGLQLMREGAKYRLWIPPKLGYGEHGAGSRIPPNALLVFDVELLSVQAGDEGAGGAGG